MKIILFLFPLLMSFSGFAQDTTRLYYPSGKFRGYQVRYDPANLFERTFFESGKLESEIWAVYTNGKRIITSMKEYYEDGTTGVLQNDSLLLRYEEDGKLLQRAAMRNGKIDGLSRTYLDGRLFFDVTYKDGIRDGLMTSYDSAGKIEGKAYYKAGKEDGPYLFYKNGRLTKSIEYVEGCPIKASYFDKEGKPTRVLTDKKKIYIEEGKPIGCG